MRGVLVEARKARPSRFKHSRKPRLARESPLRLREERYQQVTSSWPLPMRRTWPNRVHVSLDRTEEPNKHKRHGLRRVPIPQEKEMNCEIARIVERSHSKPLLAFVSRSWFAVAWRGRQNGTVHGPTPIVQKTDKPRTALDSERERSGRSHCRPNAAPSRRGRDLQWPCALSPLVNPSIRGSASQKKQEQGPSTHTQNA